MIIIRLPWLLPIVGSCKGCIECTEASIAMAVWRRGFLAVTNESAGQGAVAEFDVFISHNSADKPAVRELARLLEARGVCV